MVTNAVDTNSFSVFPKPAGKLVQPSGQAVAPLSIQTDISNDFNQTEVSLRAVKTLMAMHIGLLSEVTNSDQMFLAMIKSRAIATLVGISEEDFNEVMEGFMKVWKVLRDHHPLSGMMP